MERASLQEIIIGGLICVDTEKDERNNSWRRQFRRTTNDCHVTAWGRCRCIVGNENEKMKMNKQLNCIHLLTLICLYSAWCIRCPKCQTREICTWRAWDLTKTWSKTMNCNQTRKISRTQKVLRPVRRRAHGGGHGAHCGAYADVWHLFSFFEAEFLLHTSRTLK